MAIITKPTVSKNIPATFTLNKTELAALPSVAASAYFSNISNWNKVRVFYQSSPGNQVENVIFNAVDASPQAQFLVSDKARDLFQIQKITIIDFDGGFIEVLRSELTNPETEFDVTFSAPPVSPTITTINYTNGSYSVGQSIDFAVVFSTSDLFIQSGSPLLNLTIGSTTRTASFVSATNFGVATFNFRYTVQSGDVDEDGIVIESLDANGATFRDFVGTPVIPNLSFTPISTSIIIPSPSSNFTVGEIPGFTEIDELYNFEELVDGTYYPTLIVRGVHESNPGLKTYIVDSNLVRNPTPLEIPGGDNTQTFTTRWNRAISYREQSTGHPILLFRGRPNTSSPNRKVYKYNSFTGAVTQLSNTNPSGEDLPEAFFKTTLENPSDPTDVKTVILFAALDENGYRKLFRYNTETGTISKIQDFHANKNDNPSDFISFTHLNGDTFTYFFIDTDPDAVFKGEKTLCKMDKFGTIQYLPTFTYPVPDAFTITIRPSSYDLGVVISQEPYVPSTSPYNTRPISSMTVVGTNLIYFAYTLGASGGFKCLARVDQNGNQSVIESTVPYLAETNYPNCRTIGPDRYYNSIDGNFYFTVDENPAGELLSAYRIGIITPTLQFSYSSAAEIGNAPVRVGTSAGILYAAGTNTTTLLNRSGLVLFPEMSVVGADWVIPNANDPNNPSNNKIITMAEHDGYFYFPADSVAEGQTNPPDGLISKLRRVPLTNVEPIESELVFDFNTVALYGSRITDIPYLLYSSMGRLFFSIFDYDANSRRLFYVTHT